MSPTSRSKKMLEADGYQVWVVEQTIRIPGRTFKRDLFNGFDLLCVKDSETLAVQSSTLSNIGARVKKLAENKYIPHLRKAGWVMKCHGWRLLKKSGWTPKIIDVS